MLESLWKPFAPSWDVIFTKRKEWSDRIYYKISYKVEKLNFEFIQPLISGLTPDHLFCFLMVFLERTSGLTGLSFGRADLSFGAIGTTFHAPFTQARSSGP